ncbi:oligosaccharide flippase family protein [Nitrincola nitratireducens]|uniref:Lipopolysaccharide biosynthesis protein wzxC n=1 Tax=Nitrincola nitratireducens TaxID=1229521 RepID=W9UYQ0_9GAMM|nr:oligosaccharide flippase family protein [Nitrincola nitratireducens]EXJ09032.1 Lipopolysaccharide biosynthesis protein wzxC [Nitrincola nitratireducens]
MNKSKKLYTAIFKSMLSRYSVYTANLISLMILARIFTPDDFGTVAAVMVFYTFFQLMSEAGLGPAVINLNELTVKDRNGIFGLTILIGIVLFLVFISMAKSLANLLGISNIVEVTPYIAISIIFFSATILPNALLLREQAFFKIANAAFIAETLSTCSVVYLVQIIEPLHALALKGTIHSAIVFAFIWHFSKKTEFGRPTFGSKFTAIKPLLNFSGYQFGFNFINYFSRNLDKILVGKHLGTETLGTYDKAYQLMRYPMLLLTFAMTPAIQPVIRKLSEKPKEVESIHTKFTFKLSIIGSAAGLAMYLLSDKIVLLILGNNWSDVIPIVKIFAIAIPVQVVLSTSGSFFQAMKRSDLLFRSGLLSAIVVVIAIIIGIIQNDIIKVCWYLVIAFHINFIQAYYYMYTRVFSEKISKFLIRMIPASIIVLAISLLEISKN